MDYESYDIFGEADLFEQLEELGAVDETDLEEIDKFEVEDDDDEIFGEYLDPLDKILRDYESGNYENDINEDISNNDIDNLSYSLDKLQLKYKNIIRYRRFNLDDEVKDKLDKIKKFKENLIKELSENKIDEFEYKQKFYNLLKIEVDLLLDNEDYSLESKKKTEYVNEKTLSDKINNLVKKERDKIKNLAEYLNIEYPKLNKINKKDSNLVKLNKYLQYYLEVEKITNYVKNYMQSEYYDTKEKKYKTEIPINFKILKLREKFESDKIEKQDKDSLLIDPTLEIQKKQLKETLKQFAREDLIKCISSFDLLNSMSYIEKLKNNTVSVLKFREYPESYEELKKILGDTAKYYRIPESKLMINFTKEFYDPIGLKSNDLIKNYKLFRPVKSVTIKGKEIPINASEKGYYFLTKISELPLKKKIKNYSLYSERGSVVTLSLKPEYFGEQIYETDDILSEKYYNIVKPLPDDLYEELVKINETKNMNENINSKTDLTKVYELHIPVKEFKGQKLVRRYLNFEDYLKDLLIILEENMKNLENKGALKSADILYIKIQKIKQYLETGEDPEFEISGNYSSTTIIRQSEVIIKQREINYEKLSSFIYTYYPDSKLKVDNLEEVIFKFDNKNYTQNINKVLFIFKEFNDYFVDYMNSNITEIQLLNLELPYILPEEDIINEEDVTTEEYLKYLYSWLPKSDLYLRYKEKLDENDNLIDFKKENINLSDLEVNEIFTQMNDYKKWQNSLSKMSILQIPSNLNPKRYYVKYLKSERNKLLSRRIFRPTTINNRIETRILLKNTFKNCKIIEIINIELYVKIAELTETIIFNLSNKPDKYKNQVNLIKNSIKNLCELLSEYIIKSESESESINDDNLLVIIPIIVEFIVKEGDSKLINIERINKLIDEDINSIPKIYKTYLKLSRLEELNAYKQCLIEQQNNNPTSNKFKLIDIIKRVINEKKDEKRTMMYEIANNSYIPPVVTNILPKKTQYVIVGENKYIYGANFPNFYSTIDNSRNYKNEDIFNLAEIFSIKIDEDTDYTKDENMYKLYQLCMNKYTQLNSNETKRIYDNTNIGEYSTIKTKYLQSVSYVHYIYRPRIGVKNPGEVYKVHKDIIAISYGVPFKYSENGLPVYSDKFKDPEFKRYHYIEGPAIFEKTNETNIIFSPMYILVEYTDEYGKKIYFREGVNQKFIKKAVMDKFDACKRFKNEIDCNDINSYSLNKIKCYYDLEKNICKELVENKEIKKEYQILDELKTVKIFNEKGNIDFTKTKLWEDALSKSKKYIEQLIFIKNLSIEEINKISEEQKIRLNNYLSSLLNKNINKKLEAIIEEPTFNTLKQYEEILISVPDELKPKKDKYTDTSSSVLRLPLLNYINKAVSKSQIKKGNKYLLPDDKIDTYISTEIIDNKKYLIFENGQYLLSDTIIRETKLTETINYKIVNIEKTEKNLLLNPPSSFYYKLFKTEYKIEKGIVEEINKIIKINDIPLDKLSIIYFNRIKKETQKENDNVTREDIYNTMGEVAFNTYRLNDKNETLEPIEFFNADLNAKIYAIKYDVDIIKLSSLKIGIITYEDVVNEYNKIFPIMKSLFDTILENLEYGITNNDDKLLKKYIKLAEKKMKTTEISNEVTIKLNDMIEKSNIKIIEIEETKKAKDKEEFEKQKKKEEIKAKKEESTVEKPKQISYMISRRRR